MSFEGCGGSGAGGGGAWGGGGGISQTEWGRGVPHSRLVPVQGAWNGNTRGRWYQGRDAWGQAQAVMAQRPLFPTAEGTCTASPKGRAEGSFSEGGHWGCAQHSGPARAPCPRAVHRFEGPSGW